MATQQVDFGELVRELLKQEKSMLNNYEREELKIDELRQAIEGECVKLLEDERKKALNEADKIVAASKENAEEDSRKIVQAAQKELESLKKKFSMQKKKMVDASLSALMKEVRNVSFT